MGLVFCITMPAFPASPAPSLTSHRGLPSPIVVSPSRDLKALPVLVAERGRTLVSLRAEESILDLEDLNQIELDALETVYKAQMCAWTPRLGMEGKAGLQASKLHLASPRFL